MRDGIVPRDAEALFRVAFTAISLVAARTRSEGNAAAMLARFCACVFTLFLRLGRARRPSPGGTMDALSAVAFGVVLSACAGLRAFLPAFAASLAARVFDLPLPEYLAWLERPEALLLFGVATLLELLGDKVPVVDHALDSVQVVTKPALAVLAATPFLYQLAPEHAVAVGIAMGAPLALGVHATKAAVRVGSTATTGGIANPVLSVLEDAVAFVAVAVAFLAPVVALLLMAALVFELFRVARRLRRARRRRAPA